MADLDQLFDLQTNAALKNKVYSAMMQVADTIRGEATGIANHANRLVWAKSVYVGGPRMAEPVLRSVLAQNADKTVLQITDAADSAIIANVASVANLFAGE